MENNELIEIIKNHKCYYFDDIIKIEDFHNILTDRKSYKNVLAHYFSYKTLFSLKPQHIRFDEVDGFIRVMGLDVYYYFGRENMPFTIVLHVL